MEAVRLHDPNNVERVRYALQCSQDLSALLAQLNQPDYSHLLLQLLELLLIPNPIMVASSLSCQQRLKSLS
jgi:hypothetical protein